MITLHILQYLIGQGFITAINTDAFDESMPLGKYGLSIYSAGGETSLTRTRSSQVFELEYRHATDSRVSKDKLEKIAQHLRNVSTCQLPTIPNVSNRKYTRCQFRNVGNIQFLGEDSESKPIFKLTAEIVYNKV